MPKTHILGWKNKLPFHPTFETSSKNFHNPEAKLVDCSIELILVLRIGQYNETFCVLILGDGLAGGLPKLGLYCQAIDIRHFYGNKRKTKV